MADQFAPLGDPMQMAAATGGQAPLRGMPMGRGGPMAAGPQKPNFNPIPALQPQGPGNEWQALVNWLFGPQAQQGPIDKVLHPLLGGTPQGREGFDKSFEQRTQSGLAMADRGIKAMKENNADRAVAEQNAGREQRRQGSMGMLADAARLNIPQYQSTQDMLFEPTYTPSPQEFMGAHNAAAPRQTIPSPEEVQATRQRIQQMPAVQNGQQLEDLLFTPPLAPPPAASAPAPQFGNPATTKMQPQADLGSRVKNALQPMAAQSSYLDPQQLKAPGRPFRMASPLK